MTRHDEIKYSCLSLKVSKYICIMVSCYLVVEVYVYLLVMVVCKLCKLKRRNSLLLEAYLRNIEREKRSREIISKEVARITRMRKRRRRNTSLKSIKEDLVFLHNTLSAEPYEDESSDDDDDDDESKIES